MEKVVEVARSFRAMNTDVQAIVCVPDKERMGAERTLARIQSLFSRLEESLSRFKPDSELSALNASAGGHFKASPLLFEVVRAALNASHLTNGIFDPTILPRLLDAGYRHSFEELMPQNDSAHLSVSDMKCTWLDIRLDSASSIYLPRGCSLDLGGIGKGWAVDQACDLMERYSGYALDAGGDIRVEGTQANGSPWTIGIADPFIEGHNVRVLELRHGAICTSTTTRRKWKVDGVWQHHLIDPRSGKPSDSGVVSATVIADSAVRAETLAKAALILGPEEGLRLIESQVGVCGLLVLKNGQLIGSAGFPEEQRVA